MSLFQYLILALLSRQLAGIDNVRAGRPHHNPIPAWMFLWCGRLDRTSRPHALILFRQTNGEFGFEFCK